MRRLLAIAAAGCRLIAAGTLLAALPLHADYAAADDGDSDEAPTSVQDLRYGVVLYDFFQDDYFQALTELMLGEQNQDMPHHAEFARLLRGGISLSYGMDAQARTIFDELLAQHPRPAVRDRAWFYLGKNYYERGDADNALAMLARGGDTLPRRLAEQRDYLRAKIALDRGDLAGGQLPARDGDRMSPWLPYVLFNRGVLQSRQGDANAAAASFDQLAALPLREEEHKALRDRAFTASGYTYLGEQQSQQALAAFRQVRLQSPFADKALLGYGWAAAQLKDFELALQPWQELNQRSLLLPAVQEGLLAVPYAYEQLGAPAQALEEYQRAEQLYLQEIGRIDAATLKLRDTSLLSLWLDPRQQEAWLSRNRELPVTPQLPYLEHLLSLSAIQEILKDMRDLAVLEQYLGDWQGRLDALDTAQALQYQRRQQALRDRPDQQLLARQQELQQRRDVIAEQLQRAEQSGDGLLLVDGRELATARRLERVRSRIDSLKQAGQDVAAAEQSYQRYRGLLTWQVQENFAVRRWELHRQLRELDVQLALMQLKAASVGNLVDRARAPEQGERIRALEQRLGNSLQKIHGAQEQGNRVLRARAIAELQLQRERLVAYLSRAKLAKARLYDKGTTDSGSEVRP